MSAKSAYVWVSREGVADAARWLLHEFNANDYVTMLSDTGPDEERNRAMDLGKLFDKQSRRKRAQGQFEIRLPRDLAEWFGYFCCRPGSRLTANRAAWQVSNACMLSSFRRRGPPRLKGRGITARIDGNLGDERHQRRLRRRLKGDRELEELIRRNGGSLLGGSP